MNVIARGSDQSRTEMDLIVEDGKVDESILFIRDAPAGTRTIIGREAVGYTCSGESADPSAGESEKIWLDKGTGMLLELGILKAVEFVVDPEVAEDAFSTTPPAGADVEVVKATGG